MRHFISSIELKKIFQWYALVFGVLGLAFGVIFLMLQFLPEASYSNFNQHLSSLFQSNKIFIFLGVGFAAQMIDGALGMAYGVSSTSFLMATGVHPKMASAAVHVSEVFTTGISGISHFRMGNIDKKLFYNLLIPGMIGAAVGAYLLTNFNGEIIKPFVSAYLLLMGIYIILKAFKSQIHVEETNARGTKILALVGGFVDSVGGGGWGPVVTTTLLGSGHHPRKVIGSVNSAEFLVTLTASSVFVMNIKEIADMLAVILGLIVGGAFAAPIGAYIIRFIPTKVAIATVGALIIFLSCLNLYKFIF